MASRATIALARRPFGSHGTAVMERFKLHRPRPDQAIEFVSGKTDSEVLHALHECSSTFSRHLLVAGQTGRWCQNMRAWAHFLASRPNSDHTSSLQKEDSTTAADEEDVDEIMVRVDSRERKLIECMSAAQRLQFSVETLPVGDVIVGFAGRELFIERKTFPDLVSSIFDRRLNNQLGGQLYNTSYERFRSVVIVEGNLSDLNNYSSSLEAYKKKRRIAEGAILGMSIRSQIPVLRTSDVAGTCDTIEALARNYVSLLSWSPAQYSYVLERPLRPRKGLDIENILLNQLCCIKGVSPRIAQKLLGSHTNMQEFITDMLSTRDPVQWLIARCTPNFGRPVARRVVEALAGPSVLDCIRFRDRIAAVPRISTAKAADLASRFRDADELCKALHSDESAPEPVGRAMALAKVSRPAARGLVIEFLGEEGLE
mmetsp:Transcript_51401/g.145537  ORF Transcript_51401/g.145537 Transcript_51401/m.145537 type:complete len:428 (-) Transcript_51401:158-1441(-)